MQQSGATEIDFGGAFGFVINGLPMNANLFYIGGWYRWNDAINPYVGFEVNKLHIGISYDVNVSSLRPASNYRGGIELSLIYILQHGNPDDDKINCPKF
jgi:hypothetical protein